MANQETVLILTPLKDAAHHLDRYFANLSGLTYPANRLSLGILESDSIDGTHDQVAARLEDLRGRFRRVGLWKHDYGFRIPPDYPRWAIAIQLPRRRILAKSRNRLLFNALQDDDWVLWLDGDVCEYPPDIIERLIATGRSIVHPHCVQEFGGPTFDRNAWRDHGRTHMEDLRGGADLVRLDAVGGTMLLVRADIHREGLIFPPFPYGAGHRAARPQNPMLPAGERGEVETEGLGLLAQDMGHQCWGMPNLEIRHVNE